MQLSTQFSAIAGRKSIDRVAGVIRGVSVITEGEASGHGLHIDATTLRQVVDTASTYPGGLKVKANHGKGFESIVGAVRDFTIDGNCVRGDLYLLKAAEDRDRILEMAEAMPESFGMSISFSNQPEEIEGKKFARCAEIYSADLVDGPAANPNGLFSKPNDTQSAMSDTNTQAIELQKLQAEIADLKKAQEAIKPTDLSAVTAEITAAKTELAKLTKAAQDAAEAAKKNEISALVAEASRDGKVVPLTDVQLAKMEVADIKEMIAKLPKAQVNLSKKAPEAPKNKDGKAITLASPERIEFCEQKQAEGVETLSAIIREQAARASMTN
jgi:hypothetical protein